MSTEVHCGEDASAYVLGGLAPDQRAAFRRHMELCPDCREEVDMLQAASAALPIMSAPKPERMSERAQMIAERRADAAARRPLARRPDSKQPTIRNRLARPAPKPVMAMFGGLAVLGVMTVVLGRGPASMHIVRAQVAYAPGAAAIKVQDSSAELLAIGLPTPPAGDVYEIWVKRAGHERFRPTRALFTPNAQHEAGVNIPGGTDGLGQVEVTAEPDGGSAAPTGAPVILATLRR